jgi:hypothetical protein
MSSGRRKTTRHPSGSQAITRTRLRCRYDAREFNVDFVTVVPDGSIGVLVARIACSSQTAIDLFLNLQSQLSLWSDRVLSEGGDDGNGKAR